VPASRNNVLVEFVGLSFPFEGGLRYQYKLEGVDSEWSAPTEQRSVHYARLAAGSYRFLVRAVNTEDAASSDPVALAFHIEPPWWQRRWFSVTLMTGLIALALLLHHLRVRRILAMERIRRQIATDLHDDVGSGLSEIAILSEVARRQSAPETAPLLSEAASVARSLRDAMSDIVWSVDPTKDRASDLVQRMRQVTFNSLQTNGLRVAFSAPDDRQLHRVGLSPDRRRHVLLIFKEAITNVARHAQASQVEVRIALQPRNLRLSIRDDGCGFHPEDESNGQGLLSMKRRAAALEGRLTIQSEPGRGTVVDVAVPYRSR
jgi:signal transduction histidine kinase